MKILHIALASQFTEKMSYQENFLIKQNIVDGHEVVCISNCAKFSEGVIVYTEAEDKINADGLRLIRLPYKIIFCNFISGKIRAIDQFYKEIENINPDVILFHGLASWELLTVVRYKKNNPNVKFYADSHADFNNSATNFLSKYILHRIFYKYIIRKAYPFIDKILYLSYESKGFLKKIYALTEEKMEFYPLGGKILPDDEREQIRLETRKKLDLSDNQILFVHSGKMDKLKRTEELIKAFSEVKEERFKLLLIGNIPSDIYDIISPLIEKDCRVSYLGWKSSEELMRYLCACDVYLQPGSQSATMQNAMCCCAAVMLYPHKSHKPYLIGNGFYVETVEDMIQSLQTIATDINIVEKMRKQSMIIAKDILDYKKLAARLYS